MALNVNDENGALVWEAQLKTDTFLQDLNTIGARVNQTLTQQSAKQQQIAEQQADLLKSVLTTSESLKKIDLSPLGKPLSLSVLLKVDPSQANAELQSFLQQADAGFVGLDDQTQRYVVVLVQLQQQLARITAAQEALNNLKESGGISPDVYISSLQNLTAQSKAVTQSISELIATQKQYDQIQIASTNIFNEKKAQLESLSAEYNRLGDAEKASVAGNAKLDAISKTQGEIAELIASVAEAQKAFERLGKIKEQLGTTPINDKSFQTLLAEASELQGRIGEIGKNLSIDKVDTKSLDGLTATIQAVIQKFGGLESTFSTINTDAKETGTLLDQTGQKGVASATSQKEAWDALKPAIENSTTELQKYNEALTGGGAPAAPTSHTEFLSQPQGFDEQQPKIIEDINEKTKETNDTLDEQKKKLDEVANARNEVNDSYQKGQLTEEQYKKGLVDLDKKESDLRKTQSKPIADNLGLDTLEQKKQALTFLTEKWDKLTAAEREDVNIGGQMQQQAKGLKDEIANLSLDTFSASAERATSIMTQIRTIEQQIARDPEAPGVNALIEQAGHLRQEWENVRKAVALASSNVAGLDAMRDGLRGVVGGFTALEGVMGLFNSDNQSAAETTKLVTSAMAIATGVEQLFSVAAKDSGLNIYLRTQFQKGATDAAQKLALAEKEQVAIQELGVVAAKAQAAAAEMQAVGTAEATTAQWSLNAAIEANPIGAILIGLTALVAVLEVFAAHNYDAADAQIRLNNEIKRGIDLLASETDLFNKPADERIKRLNEQIDLLRSQHASQDKILKKELELKQAEADRANASRGFYGEEIANLGEVAVKLTTAKENLKQYQDELDREKNKGAGTNLLDNLAGNRTKGDIQKDIDVAQSSIDALTAQQQKGQAAKDAADKADLDRQTKQNELKQKLREDDLKNAVARDEAELAATQKNSKAEYEIQRKLIEDRRRLALSDPNLPDTPAAITKINDEARKAQLENDRKWDIQQLTDRKALIDKQLALVEVGTAKELALKIQSLRLQEQIQEKADGVTPQAQQALRAQELKAENDLRLKYTQDEAKAELDAVSANLNSRLAYVQKGSQEELSLREALLKNEADSEVVQAAFEIKNEELKAAKFRQIWAKYFTGQKALEDKFADEQIARVLKQIDNAATIRNAQLDQTINNPFASNSTVFEAQREKLLGDITDLEGKHAALLAQIQSGQGDVTKLQDQADQIDAAIKKANGALVSLDLSQAHKKITDLASDFGAVSSAVSSLAGQLQDMNPKLSFSLQQISAMTNLTGDLLTAGASGFADPAADIKGITDLLTFFVNAKKSAIEAKKELEAFDTAMETAQFNAAANARKTARDQAAALATTMQGLTDEAAILNKQKLANTQQFNDIMAQIAQQQFVASEHTKRTGLFFLSKEVVQDFQSLAGKSYEDLQKLFDSGRLDDKAKALFQQLEKLKAEGVDIDSSLADIQTKVNEAVTGTTADAITDSIAEGFANGDRTVAAFAGRTQDVVRNALLQALKVSVLQPAMQKIFDQFAKDAQSGGGLDTQEIANFTASINKTIGDGAKFAEQVERATGVSLSNLTGSNDQNSLKGAIKGITEQQAELLAGQMGGQRIATLELVEIQKVAQTKLNGIELHTFNTSEGIKQLLLKFDSYETGAKRLKTELA